MTKRYEKERRTLPS